MGKKNRQGNTRNETLGELGTNIPVSIEEKEGNLLEMLYLDGRDGKSMRMHDVQDRAGLKLREIKTLVRHMVQHHFIEEPDDENVELKLTDFGKSIGLERAIRHRVLTQFFSMVSGRKPEEVQAETGRLVDRVSKKTVDGMDNFIRNGDGLDHVFTNTDLCVIASYEDGTYELMMGLYEFGRTCPRVLARGYDGFGDQVRLLVEDGYSSVLLRRYDDTLPETLWYFKDGRWERAGRRGDDWVLPTRLFEMERSGDLPIMEAYLTVALPEDGLMPIEPDCMELNVHIC